MSMTDPIADMLTRIRNAQMSEKTTVAMPCSKIKAAIAQVLKDEGYIDEVDEVPDVLGKQGQIRVKLKYSMSGEKVIHAIDRASKPGCRVYRGVKELPKVLNGMGISHAYVLTFDPAAGSASQERDSPDPDGESVETPQHVAAGP